MWPSGPSRLMRWVEMLELDAGILDGEPPIAPRGHLFRVSSQAVISLWSVSMSGSRRSKHWEDRMASSISAALSPRGGRTRLDGRRLAREGVGDCLLAGHGSPLGPG